MALITSQVSAGTATSSFVVPPGPCLVTLSNGGSVTAYFTAGNANVAAGGTLTTSQGVPVPSGAALSFATYQGDLGAVCSLITASGTAAVGVIISTPSGGTGL